MNRYKKEEARRRQTARAGLTPEQVAALDAQEHLQREIEQEARQLHGELFPEEYDYMFDSNVDANERARGNNPMNQEYTQRVNQRREALGVPPLSESGTALTDDAYGLCLAKVRERYRIAGEPID